MKALRGGPGAGASDDATFLLRKIPAINFFSGFHSDYHRPSDTWDKIDAAGGAAVADLALALARQLANRRERPGVRGNGAAGSRTRAAASAPCRATAPTSDRCPILRTKARA